MAYVTSNPPTLVTQNIGDSAPAIWTYASADALATIVGVGYFANGGQLGMKLGDLVFIFVTGGVVSSAKVITVATTGTGAVTVGGGTSIGLAS